MSLYNPSTFLQVVKEDMNVRDIVLPVTDQQLYQRFIKSSLAEFSQLSPYVQTIRLSDANMTSKFGTNTYDGIQYRYEIPSSTYEGLTLLGVSRMDVCHPNGYSDSYVPNGLYMDPIDAITMLSSVSAAATTAQTMGRAPTRHFTKPNILEVWNAWMGGEYEVDICCTHDPSLTTISETSFTNLRELATYDLEAYLYGLLKRKDQLEVGVGSVNLRIDEWSGAYDKFRDLLKEWGQDANLDYDSINWY